MKAKLRAKENNCGMNMYVVCERIYILGENVEMYRNVGRFCDSRQCARGLEITVLGIKGQEEWREYFNHRG